jgi:phage tail P2-like protein
MSATDLLPPNATPLESAHSAEDNRILAADVDAIRRERDPTRCDAAFVAPLAWERSIHFWDPNDDAANRARVASSFADHGAYGSPPALEDEIALDAGLPVKVREFFELARLVWPEFTVDVAVELQGAEPLVIASAAWAGGFAPLGASGPPGATIAAPLPAASAIDIAAVTASALARKNVRDVLAAVRLVANQPASPLYVGAAASVRPSVTVLPFGLPKPAPQLFVGAASRVLPTFTVLPLRAT